MTPEQAKSSNYFHTNGCTKTVGPKGGVTEKVSLWRRSGKTQTWKTRPEHFKTPIKFGLRGSSYMTHENYQHFHLESECPIR